MSRDKHHITSAEEYQRYLEGSMPPKERNSFEKKLLEDDFENDALDGLSGLDSKDLEEDLRFLKNELKSRISKKRVPLIWRAAAVITLLATFSFVTYFILKIDNSPEVVQSKEAISDITEDEGPQALKSDSLTEIADEEGSETLLSYKMENEEAEPEQQAKRAIKEVPKPIAEQPQVVEFADDADLAVAEDITEELPAANTAAAGQIVAEEVQPAQLPTIEKEETLEMPLEIEAERRAKKSIARESVPATEMDQSNFIARIKDVRVVSGKITSEDDDAPVPGVNVIVKGSSIGTTTDMDGNYSIEVPADEDATLVYSYIGLYSEEVEVKEQDSIDVSMEEDVNNQLTEVVVTAYGKKRRPKSDRQPSTPAGPKGGNAAFEEYVKENIRYPDSGKDENVKGTVRLLLTVYPNGKITNIEVIKSLGEEFDQEAIRLVRESPGWVAATENGDAVTSKIKVKIRFRPPE